MATLKSPRLDRFGASFFQTHWQIVGNEVCNTMLKILHGTGMTPTLNFTFIALILKYSNLQLVNEFRLISLSNVKYKLVSKVLVNKLKPFMDLIIANLQSSFIPWRIITYNIIVAHELLHFMKHIGKVGKMAVKLDLSKAYNLVKWLA